MNIVSEVKEDGIKHFTLKSFSNGTLNLDFNNEIKEVFITVEEGANWVLECLGEQKSIEQCKVTITLEPGSKLEQRIAIIEEINTLEQIINIKREASYQGYLLDLTTGKFNFTNSLLLLGEGSNSYFRSAVVAQNDNNKKIKIIANNLHPYSSSIMENYGIVKENGVLLFEGIGKIDKGNHGATNKQTSKIIVFDEESQANVTPLLLIDEYDVIASHSAAVGRINEDHLYYLCSRGLTINDARQFITNGYLKPVLECLSEQIKTKVEVVLQRSGW